MSPGEFQQAEQSGRSVGHLSKPVQIAGVQCIRGNPGRVVEVPHSAGAGAPSALWWG